MREPFEIAILGDVCPDWGFRDSFDNGEPDVIFGDVAHLLKRADVSIGNLECPASLRGEAILKTGPNLRCLPDDLHVLKGAGLDALALANNHILDYGQEALLDTVYGVEACGLETFGAGKTEAEAAKPLFVEAKGWKVGFLAFAEEEFNCVTKERAGANKFDPYVSLQSIAEVAQSCDYLVVLYHGGIEHYELPSPLLQKKCRSIVAAGANLVLCQHSHCIGTVEECADATILYGQGNAIFGKKEGKDSWNQGLLVQVVLSDESAPSVRFRLFEANSNGIALADHAKETARLQKLRDNSLQLDNEDYIKRNWDEFCEKQKAMYLPMLFGRGRIFNKLNRKLDNRLISCFVGCSRQRIAMNLVRCDAHREVCQTMLENEIQQ